MADKERQRGGGMISELRNHEGRTSTCYFCREAAELTDRAADEIERLRAELEVAAPDCICTLNPTCPVHGPGHPATTPFGLSGNVIFDGETP